MATRSARLVVRAVALRRAAARALRRARDLVQRSQLGSAGTWSSATIAVVWRRLRTAAAAGKRRSIQPWAAWSLGVHRRRLCGPGRAPTAGLAWRRHACCHACTCKVRPRAAGGGRCTQRVRDARVARAKWTWPAPGAMGARAGDQLQSGFDGTSRAPASGAHAAGTCSGEPPRRSGPRRSGADDRSLMDRGRPAAAAAARRSRRCPSAIVGTSRSRVQDMVERRCSSASRSRRADVGVARRGCVAPRGRRPSVFLRARPRRASETLALAAPGLPPSNAPSLRVSDRQRASQRSMAPAARTTRRPTRRRLAAAAPSG